MNFLKKSFTALLATLTLFGTGISTPIVAEDGTTTSNNVEVSSLSHEKTATKIEGTDDYNLTLDVTGAQGSRTNKAKVDVLFIVDKSSSMDEDMAGHPRYKMDDYGRIRKNTKYDATDRRMDSLYNAVSVLTTAVSANQAIDAQYSAVEFSGSKTGASYIDVNGEQQIFGRDESYNDASITCGWTSDSSTINNDVQQVIPAGGTNYEAGIDAAIYQLQQSSRSDATKVVFFLTDGDPTLYYNYNYITVGAGKGFDSNALDAAKDAAQYLTCAKFYAVGMAKDADSYTDHLQKIVTAVKEANGLSDDDAHGHSVAGITPMVKWEILILKLREYGHTLMLM